MSKEINKVWFVWNEQAEEGIVLSERPDAKFAATGRQTTIGVSSLAYEWRELFADDDPNIVFAMTEGSIVDGVFIKD